MCFLLAPQVASGALRLMEIRDMMWIYAVVILLLPEAWCMDEGTNHTSLNSSKVYDVRYSAFNLGSEVNLTCSNKTWNEMLFVIWKIKLQYKECRIACKNGVTDDFCNDGKSLRNTSNVLSYLHIPNISADDEGVYTCESVFNGGTQNHIIIVAVIVHPRTSAWFEYKGDTVVAVCNAERGKPAANISWSQTGKSSSVETSSDGYFTVQSRLELLEGMDTENLSCVIRHPYWKEERVLLPLKPEEGSFTWLWALIVVIIVFLAGLLFFIQKKLIKPRQPPPSEAPPPKAPQTEDVEEVEPYASYVQRENSIYNSSADLFT